MSETSPLLDRANANNARPIPKVTRSVTFNPQVSTASPPSRNRPSFPSSASTSTSSIPNAGNQLRDGSQPMLSALNSKLRRRNSSGAPLQLPAAPGVKIGPQRTSVRTQKLKLLPNPELGDDGPDEESGKDVYSQFTRIKDPTARRDAARLGKDDRDKLPRVTAYCTASSYRLDELMRFLKGRTKTKSAHPKLFDECIYTPYQYRKDGEGIHRRRGSAAEQAEVHSQPQRRFSDSAIEVEENAERRREDLIDLQTDAEAGKFTQALTAEDTSAVDEVPSELPMTADFDTTVHVPEVFLFEYGVVVIWGMTVKEEQRFLKEISKFEQEKLGKDDVQTEEFNFYYTREYQARIYNDFISLREKRNYMTKLAISHALAQSTKTSLYEDLVDATITTTQSIPATIARTGRINLTRREINMQIGELFILRINIHLQGSVLDAPELMWAEPQLEPVYQAVRSYLEMDQRVGLLTERLDVIADLLQVLKDQLTHTHGEYLEWIVIVLIAAEIVVAAINILVDLQVVSPTSGAITQPGGRPIAPSSRPHSFIFLANPEIRGCSPLQSSLPPTTASSSTPKKRKLAPFASLSQHTTDVPADFDHPTYEAHRRESSSPILQPNTSNAPSPEGDRASPLTTSRAGALPPHLHDEVASAGLVAAGQSPSGAFANITIDSGSSMSGSENGQDIHTKTDNEMSAERSGYQRAASPAKRSAGEMEGTVKHGNAQEQRDSNEDVAMAGTSNDLYDQDISANSTATSAPDTMTANTSATSFQSDDPPPYSANNEDRWKVAGGTPAPTIDEQVQEVIQLVQKPLEHGDRGSVVSMRWLHKVMSRTTDNQNNAKFSKASREGDIGPVDNSDIVPANAFEEPILHDINSRPYIPLKQGLAMEEDYVVLPDQAWGMIVGWYGIKAGQKQITRYAHNTAPAEALSPNVVYEIYPPVFLVRKVPQPVVEESQKPDRARSAANELREKHERRQRGQMKADDALMVVSSRQEKGQHFLRRVKQFAGIPLTHKVQIWRVLNPTNVAVDVPDNAKSGVASPPLSRDTSPSFAQTERAKLVVDDAAWKRMDIGKDIEQIDMTDQTANDNYNGSSTIEIFSLFENQTLILEEQTRGPAGGEYLSDQKKKLLSKPKANGSKAGSTVTSRRTSPVPGSTVFTRGRRRDGKTRGTVGLSNLGNTCYMNSALQCIRSVEELAIYFLKDTYKTEINASNPLGSGGVMAKKYAEVLQGIYGDNASSSFSPNNFKKALSSQNPVFSGWGQQDSQEFLSYLVDSIHEDLNRIQKKPYLENPDSDDSRVNDPEYIRELGDTYRQNHAKRNESVCMDLFSGFYKNTMECPTCDKVSVTFDPFASLTLQLPIESTVVHNFTFVPLIGTPKNHTLDLEKNLTVKDVKKIIASKHGNVDASKLWMVEVYSHKIYKHFDDSLTVAEAAIAANDFIFVFELADVPSNIPPKNKSYGSYNVGKNLKDVPKMDSEAAESFAVPIFHRKKNRLGSGWEIIMHPQYVTIKRDETRDYNAILKKVLHTVAQLTSRPILVEADEKEHSSSAEAEKVETNGDADIAENTQDDAARLSDHSVSSEDGYVAVSMDDGNSTAQAENENEDVTVTVKPEGALLPDGFHRPDYQVPAILRDQIFTMNYARGAENMFCFGTTAWNENSLGEMSTRVKAASRRLSTGSSTADDASTNDGSSPVSMEGEESDEDEDTTVQISTEDSSAAADDAASDTADSDLPENPLENKRRGNKKENKFKGNKSGKPKKERLSKKEKREMKKAAPRAAASSESSRHSVNMNDAQDDEVHYLKLNECIVIDWFPEAIDSIFGGNSHDDDGIRGRWLSHEEGKDLPIIDDPASEEKRKRRELRKKYGITLEDCFMETGKREKLSEDNAWYCNRCKELRQATKTLEIWTCPDIVVVHLKRFGGTRSFRDKIDVLVDYPIEGLDLTEKIGQKEDGKSYIYDLFAVDNHFGGLGGGHYTASAKNFFDGQWYDYNDSMTSKLGDAPRKSAAAYLLFYRRRSDKPLGPQYLQDLVTEFRNPPEQANSNSADESYGSDSGEGRLGDPSSILRGSSSNSVGAGVEATTGLQHQARTTLPDDGNGSAGQQAGQNLKPRALGMSDDEGIDMAEDGPAGNNRQYGNVGPPSWDFEALNSKLADSSNAEMRPLDKVDGDADSTAAEHDTEREDSWNDLEQGFQLGGDPTTDDEYQDNHALYSGSRESGALHLEDTTMMNDDAPAIDINLPDANAKMD